MAFATGMQIGKYLLSKKLGEGGFGLVFKAQDTNLDREVALKFLHPEHTANAEILRRFLQEARSAAKIVHPGIVTVFECGQISGTGSSADGTAYIAMELLDGESLSDRLARAKRLPYDAASEITWQVASALEAAHRAGIIHRDLKPDNIFICRDPAMPSGERIKVLDFGIAKLAQAHGTGAQTRTQMVMGTPPYMSPEQCRSATHIDPRSDIYTLGCILFELVCGKPPFDGEAGELIAKHQMVAPPTARSMAPDIPPALDALIAAMLAKQPNDRPQSMAAVQQALGASNTGASGGSRQMRAQSHPGAAHTPAQGVPAVHDQATMLAAQRTTLGGAAGQAVSQQAAPKSRASLFVVGGLAIAALVGGGIFLATRDKDTKPAASETAATPTPAAEAPAQPPSPPSAPDKITIELDATPKAEVWTFDGRLLGSTPYKSERAPAEGMLVFWLKAEGHSDQRVEVAADKSGMRKVELAAVAPVAAKAEPKPTATKPAEPKPRPTTKPKPKPTQLKPGDIVID